MAVNKYIKRELERSSLMSMKAAWFRGWRIDLIAAACRRKKKFFFFGRPLIDLFIVSVAVWDASPFTAATWTIFPTNAFPRNLNLKQIKKKEKKPRNLKTKNEGGRMVRNVYVNSQRASKWSKKFWKKKQKKRTTHNRKKIVQNKIFNLIINKEIIFNNRQ